MESPTLTIVKEVTEDLLKRMQCEGEVSGEMVPAGQGRFTLEVNINSPDSRHLIGQLGNNLHSLQYVIRLLVSAKTGRPCFAKVDVNKYRAQKEDAVTLLAKEMAEKATRTDNLVILRPMTSFERRLVHVALQENKEITTESLGQEPNRRVVIKPLHESRVVRSLSDKGFTLDDIKI